MPQLRGTTRRRRSRTTTKGKTSPHQSRPAHVSPQQQNGRVEHETAPSHELPISLAPNEITMQDVPNDSEADIVFQCASCKTILGDTQSEYQAHLHYHILSLKAASHVSIQKELLISKTGFDAGCAYKNIVCSECQSHLGRTYSSTTPELDCLRSSYTFLHTALLSYQLGSSKMIDGKFATHVGHRPNQREQRKEGYHGDEQPVSPAAFDALDSHVTTLTDATNKLTEAFDQNRKSITETKQTLDANSESVAELREAMECAQNMILLWEERFQRLNACEQGLAKLTSDCDRYEECERRVGQIEDFIRNASSISAPTRQGLEQPQSTTIKLIPTIRKPSASPARPSARRRR